MALYTTSQAAKAVGISLATIRNLTTGRYASAYVGLFSSGATPGTGTGRVMTESDIAILRYIRGETLKGRLHEAIAADIRAGALEDAQAEEDRREPQEPTPGGEAEPQSGAMVLYSWGRLLQSQLAESHERETDLTERLIDAERRAAAAESRAQALADHLAERQRGFLARLFGR